MDSSEEKRIAREFERSSKRLSWWTAVCSTLVFAGPVGWFFLDLSDGRYDRLVWLFVMSLVTCALATWRWIEVIRVPIAESIRKRIEKKLGACEPEIDEQR
jgi:hypothetical protein